MKLVLPSDVLVSEVMSTDIFTIPQDETVTNAYRLMRSKHIRGLPVIDSGKLVGIFTLGDAQKIQRNKMASTQVGKVMTKHPVVGYHDENLVAILQKMSENRVGILPIISQGTDVLIGVVTNSDLKGVSRLHEQKKSKGSDMITALACPSCRAPLDTPTSRFIKCKYCGTSVFLRL